MPAPAPPPALHVVLVAPEIPPNTGAIGRLCVATGSRLHLVKPLGFRIDDRTLTRAGLDYWDHLDWRLWDSFDSLRTEAIAEATAVGSPDPRFFFFTTKGRRPYWDQSFKPGDHLVFGRETRGLPESLLAAHPDLCLTIPMHPAARSLNLATATAITLYEACRQIRSI
ncbi:MAG: tRNA (cytidine(34)-2'-O)-methyltransferase [Verrucomicrobiales bacterium]